MSINIRKFPVSDVYKENIEEIRTLYPGKREFRVSPYEYDAGRKFSGSSENCLCFIISGSCELTFSNTEPVVVKRGDVFEWPSGRYWVEAGDSAGVKYVNVWNLKEIIERRAKNTQ